MERLTVFVGESHGDGDALGGIHALTDVVVCGVDPTSIAAYIGIKWSQSSDYMILVWCPRNRE